MPTYHRRQKSAGKVRSLCRNGRSILLLSLTRNSGGSSPRPPERLPRRGHALAQGVVAFAAIERTVVGLEGAQVGLIAELGGAIRLGLGRQEVEALVDVEQRRQRRALGL